MLRFIDGKHAFTQYEDELKHLIESIDKMRRSVLQQFSILNTLLVEGKKEETNAKAEARDIDRDVNKLERGLEKNVLDILSSYNLQSTELRLILSITKLAAQLERIGDHCKNSVKRAWRMEEKISDELHSDLLDMVKATSVILDQLEMVLLRFDEKKAIECLKADDEIDMLYKKLVMKMPSLIADGNIEEAAVSDFLFLAKNLERIADRAMDIIYEMYYVHNGNRLIWDTEEE